MNHLPFLIATLALTDASAPIQPLSTKDVDASLTIMRDFKQADTFSAGPDRALFEGREFVVSWRLKNNDRGAKSDCADCGSGYWAYDPETKQLKVSIIAAALTGDGSGFPGGSAGYSFKSTPRVFGTPFEAQNSYGAKVMVTPSSWSTFNIVEPHAQYDPGRSLVQEFATTLEPDKARELVAHIQVSATGIVQPYDGKHTLACGTNYVGAKVDSPTESSWKTCSLSVSITSLSLRRDDTNEIIAEWSEPLSGGQGPASYRPQVTFISSTSSETTKRIVDRCASRSLAVEKSTAQEVICRGNVGMLAKLVFGSSSSTHVKFKLRQMGGDTRVEVSGWAETPHGTIDLSNAQWLSEPIASLVAIGGVRLN